MKIGKILKTRRKNNLKGVQNVDNNGKVCYTKYEYDRVTVQENGFQIGHTNLQKLQILMIKML